MSEIQLANRSVLHLTGAGVRAWLQGLVTQDVAQLTPDAPLYAGLLSPQGKALFDLLLHDDGAGGIWLDVDSGQAEALQRRLMLYRLRARVDIAVRADLAVFAHWQAGAAIPGKPRDPRHGALGQRWIAPAGAPADAPAMAAYQAHRWQLGVAEGSDEITPDKHLWLETNAEELNGVSYTKGCYVGQENTARMHHRNKVRKRILAVQVLDAKQLISAMEQDARFTVAGKPVGELLVQAQGDHAAMALALLRIDGLEPDTALDLHGSAWRILWPDFLEGAVE